MVYSDIVHEAEKTMIMDDKVETVECECCGWSEDCTPAYIRRVKGFFCGKWVCGLCSEAVKEQIKRSSPSMATDEEALKSHVALYKNFNRTVRMNPKLSLVGAMRDIAQKCSQRRASHGFHAISCGPRIDVKIRNSPSIQ